MKLVRYDAVVIGGGPAGSAAGLAIAKTGASVCLVERERFPRRKTCAGILTEKTIRLLYDAIPIFSPEIYRVTNKVSLLSGADQACTWQTHYPFVLVERNIFDNQLLTVCKEAGVRVWDGNEAVKFLPEENRLILSDGRDISYRVLIGADGIHSRLRRCLNIPDIQKGFCIQNELSRSECSAGIDSLDGIYLDFGDIPFGYSWIIPNRNHIIVGTGVLNKSLSIEKIFQEQERLCKKIGFPQITPRRGAYVPIGELADQTQHSYSNVVLIGDAAGLANPLTGEGIYLALLSGQIAGKAFLQQDKGFKSRFLTMLQNVANQIDTETKLFNDFYDVGLLKQINMQFCDFPDYLAGICDNVVSLENQTYQDALSEIKFLLR